MRTGLLARKLGMTRVFMEDGAHLPVTILKVDSCQVVAQRTEARDGYSAVQIGLEEAKNIPPPLDVGFDSVNILFVSFESFLAKFATLIFPFS